LERAWVTAGQAEVMLVAGTSTVVQPATFLAGAAKAVGT
jgi:NAD-dependent SIR2 family protein deacetylase